MYTDGIFSSTKSNVLHKKLSTFVTGSSIRPNSGLMSSADEKNIDSAELMGQLSTEFSCFNYIEEEDKKNICWSIHCDAWLADGWLHANKGRTSSNYSMCKLRLLVTDQRNQMKTIFWSVKHKVLVNSCDAKNERIRNDVCIIKTSDFNIKVNCLFRRVISCFCSFM